MTLTIRALTSDLWPALEDLFGPSGAVGGCWCMYWRIGTAYRKRPRAANRVAFRDVVRRGPPPGLLAFDGDVAVGWCQLTPRDALPGLDRVWRLRRVDALPVWSLSCFYVRKGYRRRGVATALIRAAVTAARRAKAPALEAYPLDGDRSPSASFTGYASTFARAGFEIVARHSPERPIVRLDLTAPGRPPVSAGTSPARSSPAAGPAPRRASGPPPRRGRRPSRGRSAGGGGRPR
jgi:GNAT superfamily N-acetyltransferase